MFDRFRHRSYQLEHLDKGDYTPEEYEGCIVELQRVNEWLGDASALRGRFRNHSNILRYFFSHYRRTTGDEVFSWNLFYDVVDRSLTERERNRFEASFDCRGPRARWFTGACSQGSDADRVSFRRGTAAVVFVVCSRRGSPSLH